MKRYSKKWMQSFVEGELPADKQIIEDLSKKSFEVESVENSVDGDSLFEIKVLPNRVSDAMSVEGMASELAAVYDFKKTKNIPLANLSDYTLNNEYINIENKKITSTSENPLYIFTGLKVEFDNSLETPEWIKDILEKSGGRSINCMVDITNMMLFVFGQPAHVFDFDKLRGGIVTRFATDGEELELLDGRKIKLDTNDFVIADTERALSLAGIKGGKLGEVDTNTKVGLFEMANFNPTMIRKSSQKHGVRTDASKIFENGITTAKTENALQILISTILDIDKNAKIEFIINQKIEDKLPQYLEVKISDINNFAGKTLEVSEIKNLLERQNFEVIVEGEILKVKGDKNRTDVNISADVVEEVLRLYGFDNLPSREIKLENNANNNVSHAPRFLVENYIKLKLISLGFTEIFNYTFVDSGNVKVELGLASDKEYLRANLLDGAKLAFTKNYNYLPTLETEILKFFEIGTVFLSVEKEEKRIILVLDDGKKKTKYLETLQNILTEIETELGIGKIEIISSGEKPAMLEFSIDKIVDEVVEKNINILYKEVEKEMHSINYKPLSVFPFIVRDVAVWVSQDFSFEDLKKDVLDMKLENFEKVYKFDEFEKEGKKSVAFRIIFQSYSETLTDEKIEIEMQKVYTYLKDKNLEIR